MRRLIAVTLIAPAILAAAEQGKSHPALLSSALTRGVTNDRPYLPSSRIEGPYQAARSLVARTESQLMAGTLTVAPQAEIATARANLDNGVLSAGSITEHERHQYEEAVRDLDALITAMANLGLGVERLPGFVVAAPVPAPSAAPSAAPEPILPPSNEAPLETPAAEPARAPVEATQAPAELPAQAPVVEQPAQVEAPAPPPELPAEAPAVEQPAIVAPAPAETPAAVPAEEPAQVPAEEPANVPAEEPAKAPAEVPAAAPADALPPE